MLKKRQNNKYKFVTRDDFISELNQSIKSKDNKYQLDLLGHAVNYLDEFNITTYEDIISVFKNYGITSKEMIIIMNEFKKYMKEHKDKNDDTDKRFNTEWLNMRSFKILKFSGKNIILNRILLEFPDYFTIFLDKYFKENDAVCFNFCLDELQNKIKLIRDQSQKNFTQINNIKKSYILGNVANCNLNNDDANVDDHETVVDFLKIQHY